MRKLPDRGVLSSRTMQRLAADTAAIVAAANPKSEAHRRYTNARRRRWFEPVIERLRELAGDGERCMLCSGSEASQVEHFRPNSWFPHRAMDWTNFLWSCGLCNQRKAARFTNDADPLQIPINPLEEDCWAYFFIDEFGQLTPRWDGAISAPSQRGEITIDHCSLDREALQLTRAARLKSLSQQVTDTLTLFTAGDLDATDVQRRISQWLSEPFQSDVADYFLRGPGTEKQPFSSLFRVLE